MDKSSGPDWSLIRSFLAVADAGSLSAAARELGSSQPTVGRHISDLEQALGITLFKRQPRGLALTEDGLALVEPARAMRGAATALNLAAQGRGDDIHGTVRITTSVVFAHFHMPQIIARIRETYPEIAIELVPTDQSENLLFHEADIAVRMYRPTQLDVVATKVGQVSLGLFATRDYLDRCGAPTELADIEDHTIIGYDRSDLIIRGMRAHGLNVDRDFFDVRCDDQAAYWHLVRAGCGIGVGQVSVAQSEPDVLQVLSEVPLEPLPVWLAMPAALRNIARVKYIFDMLKNEILLRTQL